MPEKKSGTRLRTSQIRHRQTPGKERRGAPRLGSRLNAAFPIKLAILIWIAAEATRNGFLLCRYGFRVGRVFCVANENEEKRITQTRLPVSFHIESHFVF